MNEQSGNLVQDLSGEGNHGTNNGADWAAGGLDFNGTSDYVNCGNDASLDITDAITIEAWVKVNSIPFSGWTDIIRQSSWTGVNGYGIFGKIGESVIRVQVREPVDIPVNKGIWTHIVMTFDFFNTLLSGYKNGELIGTYNDASLVTSSDDLVFGGGKNLLFFNGSIADVRIYNRALSPKEIAWLHREPYAMFQKQIDPALTYYETPSGITVLDYERSIRGMSRGMNRGIS